MEEKQHWCKVSKKIMYDDLIEHKICLIIKENEKETPYLRL